MPYYTKHVFFCTNDRKGRKKSCEDCQASQFKHYAKKRIKQLGLSGKGGIRISTSGCLGRCEEGPCLVIYPEGIWYTFYNKADIDDIISKHLENNQLVEHLLLDSD